MKALHVMDATKNTNGTNIGSRFFHPVIQSKLTINNPNDEYEKEADAMADKVMRMPAFAEASADKSYSGIQLKPLPVTSIQRKCAHCEEEESAFAKASADKEKMQRKEMNGEETTADSALENYVSSFSSNGQSLPHEVRSFYEPRFGYDFSNVKVHTDSVAAKSAQSINALAYTLGKNIVFNSGQYSPHKDSGKRLLGHELTHVVQQAGDTFAIQRTIGDGHDLTSPRFAGNIILEAVYDNERLLRSGNTGTAVRKLQQALIDSGFSLPRFGVDGKFGPETKAAVEDFQRGSGLVGANIDGIVGPTTMGFLDQRFSAGPTPAGTSPGATTGCPVIKTLNVDLVSLDGSTRNPLVELDHASTILNQCCVHLQLGGGGTEDATRTNTLLSGNTVLSKTPVCGRATAEELALFSGASADFGLSSSIRGFYVNSTIPAVPAYDFPPFCATGTAAPLLGMAVVTNAASVRGLAHEIAHILLNSGTHPADPLNLMSAPGTPPGEQLTPAQCATIFAAVP